MSEVLPYIILHIPLENYTVGQLNISADRNGWYLVFWWKNIPLGDQYIEAGQLLEEDKFKAKVLRSISSAIDFYITKYSLPLINYSDAFLIGDIAAFASLLDLITASLNTYPIPTIVDISVIICTRNRSSCLTACLDSLLTLPCVPKEIIVVDNAPSDDETNKLVSLYKNVRYCLQPRKGLDIARNTGAYIATCPIIAYVDDDVSLHPLWAYEVWKSFSDPAVAAITGLVFASDLSSEAQQIFEKHWSFNRGYIDKKYNSTFFKSNNAPRVWEIGAGASMAFRKSVLKITGYFDERLDAGAAGCNGDSEIWYRILLNGYDILYNPRVVSHHRHRADLVAFKKQIFNYIKGHVVAALIQQKHNKNAAYKRYIYWEMPKYYLLLFKCGFPAFSSRYQTWFTEIKGFLAGLLYFYKHRNRPSKTFS